VDNQRLYLRAGREGVVGDVQQGLLEVDQVDKRGPYPDGIEFYMTPQRLGAVHISNITGALVILMPDDPQAQTIFTFDLATRQWVPPGLSPVPSLVPSPSL
jgi:hypothetical protein